MDHMEASERPRVVIAGGTGFIGRRLAAVLGGAGHDVVILSRSRERPPVGPVRFARWSGRPANADASSDQSADASWPSVIEGARAVVNLCGAPIGGPRWSDARKAELLASRVEPTRALVEAVNTARRPPSVFVQASGVGYYGTGDAPVDESSPAGNDFLANLAVQWEAPLEALRADVRGVVTRFGVVLGSTGGALAQMLLPFRLFVGGPIASGNQWLSWVHLHDAVDIVQRLIDAPDSRGVYNVVAPEPVRNAEFAQTAGAALHRPSFLFTPRFLLKALLGEQATLVCDGQQVIGRRLSDFPFTYPTLKAALEHLV
jgi:hypothetical protein